jgi:GNAT superfamily N-acetyltransferase
VVVSDNIVAADLTSELSTRLSDVADETVRRAIAAPLVQFNEARAGPSGNRPLVVELRSAEGVIGGLWGNTAYGWLFIQLLAVPTELHRHGWGRRLMSEAEEEARNRGCHSAWLDTFEFQSRGFYERLGYSCFATLPEYPKGFSRYFLCKRLGGVGEG